MFGCAFESVAGPGNSCLHVSYIYIIYIYTHILYISVCVFVLYVYTHVCT